MNALLIIGIVLMVLGIIGSIIPWLPGPILSFLGLIMLYFGKPDSISVFSLIIFGSLVAVLIVFNYIAPILGAKFSGASKKGLIGAILGCLIGFILLSVIGVFIGAFLGAVIGEAIGGKKNLKALKAGIGTLAGSFFMIIIQIIFSIFLAIYFLINLIK